MAKSKPRTQLDEIHRRIEHRVDEWLEANGQTRTWLARETGMGAASMRRVLAGPAADVPTSPTLRSLDRLAAVLGIGVDELVSPLVDR